MHAIFYDRYGSPDVLRYEEVRNPIPADDEVLIRVRAAGVNPYDWHFMRGSPHLMRIMTGVRNPKDSRLGADVAGVIEAAGRNVAQFKTGDSVFGICKGSFAEYACAAESKIAIKPENLTFEQAGAVGIAALTALQGLRDKGKIQAGQKVLINGAAGGVGTFAVQIARSFGADVTGVCSTRNAEMVRSIGADHVVDYTREDVTQRGQRYDLFFDCIGNHSWRARLRTLNPKGIYVGVGGASDSWSILSGLAKKAALSPFVSQKLVGFIAKVDKDDLTLLGDLMQSGKVTPVIDRCYSLRQTAEAIRYVEEGHARGKVVIRMEPVSEE